MSSSVELDHSANLVYHYTSLDPPCLSFDVVIDDVEDKNRGDYYPLTIYDVAGSQASKASSNSIILFKITNLHSGHSPEGYALDSSPISKSILVFGDTRSKIHISRPDETGFTWNVDQRSLIEYMDSVEDIQRSLNEVNVMASFSTHKFIRIWDVRSRKDKSYMLTVDKPHQSDVNVINWNRSELFIVSGGDDRAIKVLFGSAGEDDQVVIWDLSVEKNASLKDAKVADLPPHFLFIHQRLEDLTEMHWHKQIPGLMMATSHTGLDVFRTISV
ncbi:RRB1 [Lepeophtheirus salmonis]|uniref:RRB1 n=1 Tax=Lepeophtheirus salmonis TaxID=72036 RepID=A0A7R8DCC5_LEPSM|nr:RRB1 [Lepeophtheirus salmonis]CAF3041419.1 RRB1 [Lepeophtheirus salmonis]